MFGGLLPVQQIVVSMTGMASPVCGGYAHVMDTRDEHNHVTNPGHPLVMQQIPNLVHNR